MVEVSIEEASRLLGVSQETVRRRIRNGELEAHQEARPQGYIWRIMLPDDLPSHLGNGYAPAELADALRDTIQRQDDTIAQMRSQLEAKDKQIEQLHVLLQQAQAALPTPRNNRPWWQRVWRRD